MKRTSIHEITVSTNDPIRKAIENMDNAGKGIILVIDNNSRLRGIITDGDLRRAILRGISLEDSASDIMNENYVFVSEGYNQKLVTNLFDTKPIRHIPVLDDDMNVVDLICHEDLDSLPHKENYALIMAGGLGARLRPLTEEIPKPMLRVGARPILETIIEQLKSYGYTNILISVNYKAESIESYFQDGSSFGVNIKYIREKTKLGTGGAIKLAEEYLEKPFLVLNGDILTKLNFEQFMDFHETRGNKITIAAKKQELQIPYGVMELEGEQITSLKEKPSHSYYINGGMYCLSPEVIQYIPEGTFFNITDLISLLLENKMKIGSFIIREYWMDIGHIADYHQANKDYNTLFEAEERIEV